MTFRQLELLVALAANQSIAATAIALDHSPATVSRQISALEKDVGVALLNRNAGGVTLSPAGQRLCERAGALLKARDSAARYARDNDNWPPIKLGTSEDFVEGLAARIAQDRDALDRPVELVTGSTAQLVSALIAGTVDRALLCSTIRWPGLRVLTKAGSERFSVVARHDIWTATEPNAVAWIRSATETPTQRLMRRWLDNHNIRPAYCIIAESNAARIQFALTGAGYALLPDRLAERYIRSNELVASASGHLSFQIDMSWYAPEPAPYSKKTSTDSVALPRKG
ncbi:LysR family transcriptional regulator [Salinisphaera hydrothermalis]|uniref:LysR family transcriptional regulator n=1 Tax=Salinisphaera hydrothermalis TaxID=563188 RepID=UPI00333E8DD7